MKRSQILGFVVAASVALFSSPAGAQLSGENFPGDFGLRSGSQPPFGVWVAPTYLHWQIDRIKGRDGGEIDFQGDLDVNVAALLAWVVTPVKVLGANYGFMVAGSLVSNAFEFPRVGLESGSGLALADMYFVPVNLGWHNPRTDFMASLGFYAPTGEYEPGGSENKGYGMWTFEASAGSTVYFDAKRQWHIAALAFYETHTDKEDQDLKPGDLLTIEGGLGGSFAQDRVTAGLAYAAQWKISEDSGDDFPSGLLPGKNHTYELGPELTWTFVQKPPWVGTLTARYLWDLGARSAFEGQRLVLIATIGHLNLKALAAEAAAAQQGAPAE